MIVPSIDIMDGRAVQLRRGRELALDGGDPLDRLAELSVAGEVAVVDLDAALGRGSNTALIREMVRRAPCRVGGGIRDLDAARDWLDRGAEKIVIGTMATEEFCAALPRERVVAAVDTDRGAVVVEGWTTRTGDDPIGKIAALAPYAGGFLLTQVEREGLLGGFDMELVTAAVRAAGGSRVTAAGGITCPVEIEALDRVGADAQVGMALYSGRLTLGAAVAAPLAEPLAGGLWPTVVRDGHGQALGLAWSTRESIAEAVRTRRGVYWSRSRGELWVKGETSGNRQELVRVDLDCDRDALCFTVRQHGAGFCHEGTRGCWPVPFDLGALADVIAERGERGAAGSGTARLLAEPGLLRAKLLEEAEELAGAATKDDAVHEAADVIYFTLVRLVLEGGALDDVIRELARRHGRVRRRPMRAKGEGGGSP